jgi:hypothetical protein
MTTSDPLYTKLTVDPTNKTERRTTALIRKLDIPKEDGKRMTPYVSVPPRLYGLPKIHKKGVPLRPIMNCISSPTYALAKYLRGLLSSLVGQSDHHIKNLEAFIQKLQGIQLNEADIVVSFDVVSLFTKVPLDDTLQLLSGRFQMQTVDLIRHVLMSMYILYNGSFYNQKDGVTMGSPLVPVVANIYMEHFEKQAISSAVKKPARWYTFVVWPHGEDELQGFLEHLNSIHQNIAFTMEVEQQGTLPFLDVLVRRTDGSLGHWVYRKPMHTDLYLYAKSEHHPAQKPAMLSTLV